MTATPPDALGRPSQDGYLPIADHGVIGDLHTVALVGVEGTIDWWCCPRFDSPSVFGAILDARQGGYWSLSPSSSSWTARQLYLPDTNVLITRFLCARGVVELEDFMPTEGPLSGRHAIVRRVLGVRGRLDMTMALEPRFDYGRASHRLYRRDDGVVLDAPQLRLMLAHQVPVEVTERDVRARFALEPGQTLTFVLGEPDIDGTLPPCTEVAARASFDATVAFWRRWLERSRYTGRWREMVHRSALTLKLLTYAPTGAIVAAPTTSLPEALAGARNWDYRYTWLRDAAFSLFALLRLGFTDEAGAFMGWLTDRFREQRSSGSGPLQLMYDVNGGAQLPEEELTHLAGYRGSRPVRVGNRATTQLQLDTYGELMDSVYLYNKYGEPIYHDAWQDLSRIVDWLCDHWDQPDEGIWETRGGRHHFTYSRLMSWVALERALRIARQRGLPHDVSRWSAERDRVYHQIMTRGWHEERRAFVQHYDNDVLDAAVLLMPMVKFVSPRDPRWLATLQAIGNELVVDSLVYRYDPQLAPDGLGGSEGTFTMCSFWWVEALARAGSLDEARLIYEKMLTYANHLGLYSEEIGPSGEQLGNFPQAFAHLSLISAAFTLDRALG